MMESISLSFKQIPESFSKFLIDSLQPLHVINFMHMFLIDDDEAQEFLIYVLVLTHYMQILLLFLLQLFMIIAEMDDEGRQRYIGMFVDMEEGGSSESRQEKITLVDDLLRQQNFEKIAKMYEKVISAFFIEMNMEEEEESENSMSLS